MHQPAFWLGEATKRRSEPKVRAAVDMLQRSTGRRCPLAAPGSPTPPYLVFQPYGRYPAEAIRTIIRCTSPKHLPSGRVRIASWIRGAEERNLGRPYGKQESQPSGSSLLGLRI